MRPRGEAGIEEDPNSSCGLFGDSDGVFAGGRSLLDLLDKLSEGVLRPGNLGDLIIIPKELEVRCTEVADLFKNKL